MKTYIEPEIKIKDMLIESLLDSYSKVYDKNQEGKGTEEDPVILQAPTFSVWDEPTDE